MLFEKQNLKLQDYISNESTFYCATPLNKQSDKPGRAVLVLTDNEDSQGQFVNITYKVERDECQPETAPFYFTGQLTTGIDKTELQHAFKVAERGENSSYIVTLCYSEDLRPYKKTASGRANSQFRTIPDEHHHTFSLIFDRNKDLTGFKHEIVDEHGAVLSLNETYGFQRLMADDPRIIPLTKPRP